MSIYPQISESAFIGPFSSVIGDVIIEKNVFVGANVVIRADEGTPFYIGCNSNIQDRVIFHGLKAAKYSVNGIGYSIYIGKKVSIAHGALIHGPAIVENNTFVGFNSDEYINSQSYKSEELTPVVNLVSDEEAFQYLNDVSMKLESNISLSEYISKYKRLKYNYDFEDNWKHYIEVENIIDDYDKNYAVCVEGEGNTPPEDVGGDSGYEEILNAVSHAEHPEHENMLIWGESQGYKEFDI